MARAAPNDLLQLFTLKPQAEATRTRDKFDAFEIHRQHRTAIAGTRKSGWQRRNRIRAKLVHSQCCRSTNLAEAIARQENSATTTAVMNFDGVDSAGLQVRIFRRTLHMEIRGGIQTFNSRR
jgi:hypothetical protein